MGENGQDLKPLLVDNERVLMAAWVDSNGNLQLCANGYDIQKLATAYYLLKNNVDVRIQMAIQRMQAQANIVIPDQGTINRLRG